MTIGKRTGKALICRVLFFAAVAAGCFLFYTRITPMVIYNMDDWSFLVPGRAPWPVWGGWNPSRVLPEVLMPLTAWASAKVISPLAGGLIPGIEAGMALAVSGMVTAYAFCFFRLAAREAGDGKGMLLTLLFLGLHLLVFRTKPEGNDHLLAGYYDTTTYFFYLIPALWNGSLVMFLMAEDYFQARREKPAVLRIFILLAVYLGIFSDLYQSAVLAGYTGIDLLAKACRRDRRERIRLRDAWFHLLILGLWLVSLVFEYFGGRSQQIGADSVSALGGQLRASGTALLERLGDVNPLFTVFLLAAAAGFLLTLRGKAGDRAARGEQLKKGLIPLAGAVLLLIYEWLLCGASFYPYVQRGDVLICPFFFLFLFMLLPLCGIRAREKQAWTGWAALVLAVILCAAGIYTPGKTWLDRTNGRIGAAEARRITGEITAACEEADKAGEKAVSIPVPAFGGDNWPLSLGGAGSVSKTLLRYGRIHRKIKVTFSPDPRKNEEYGIAAP